MDKYFISLIIPVYNVEKYLERCILSIVNQKPFKEKTVEIILVDDGSTDNSGKICDIYAEKYVGIKVIHQNNGGLSSARNTGIKVSDGEYIQFLDSDDTLETESIEVIIEALTNKPDILLCRYNVIDINTGIKSESTYHLDRLMIRNCKSEKLLDYLVTGRLYNWYAWLNVVKRTFVIDKGFYFTEGRCFEDTLWTPEILYAASSVDYLDKPVYNYYVNRKDSITKSVSDKIYDDKFNALEFIETFCKEKRFSENTYNKMLGNISQIYVSLLADKWLLEKSKRKIYEKKLEKYDICLKYSVQCYKRILYSFKKIIGLKGISFILYIRAEYVRKKNGI